MDVETFPVIENFQKLPRKVIVKAGHTSFTTESGTQVRGLVINNSGHAITDVRVHIVVFNPRKIPVFSSSIKTEPDSLSQGSMASFTLELKEFPTGIPDYYLYANWRLDDLE